MSLALASRLARRELRGGLRGFRVFLACLVLGVAAIAAIGSVREGVRAGLAREGASLLGGDAAVELSYRFATAAERQWLEAHALEVSEIAEFRSMVLTETGARALTEVKAVDEAWPLYGAPVLDPPMPLAQALAGAEGVPGVVMHPDLIARLGLEPGEVVRLGGQPFRLMAALVAEPDNAGGGFALGPRSLVRLADLGGSNLVGPGSLFSSEYRLKLAPGTDLDALSKATDAAIGGARWHDQRNAAPGLRMFVDRLSSFLILVGLAGLAVGGVGVSSAVRSYLEEKTETIAVLKTLGAGKGVIFQIYALEIAVLTALGIGLGVVLGGALPWALGPVISRALPVPADFTPHLVPLAEAAAYGALAAAIFTLWPLARLRRIGPAALFRESATGLRGWPGPVGLVVTGLLVAALIALAIWRTGSVRLVLGAGVGFAGAALMLGLTALIVRLVARALAHGRFGHGRPALRMALAALGSRGGGLTATMLSLGLGLSVLASIGQIDNNLRGAIERELPEIAPALFVINIQPDQIEAIRARVAADPELRRIEDAPMLRGVITKINGRPAREVAGDHWVLRGDRGVTYSDTLPPRSRLVAGKWWPPDYTGPPQISFAADEAAEMGLSLGDTLTVNILGRDITGTITSLRKVDFSGAAMGFVLAMDPAALKGAPHTILASIYASQAGEAALMRELSDMYPNLTVISVRDALSRISVIMGSIAAAITYSALVTLVTGLVVLIGAAAADQNRRNYEAALLKTLGATRGGILASFALRTIFAGFAAGAVAVAAGALGAWSVMHFVMKQDFSFAPLSALAIVLGGVAVTLIASLGFTWKSLMTRPAEVLRARE